jgi:hypothetical protein
MKPTSTSLRADSGRCIAPTASTHEGAQEAEEQARVTKLLWELIDDISRGFEEPTMQAEPIPEREAASLDRLLGS